MTETNIKIAKFLGYKHCVKWRYKVTYLDGSSDYHSGFSTEQQAKFSRQFQENHNKPFGRVPKGEEKWCPELGEPEQYDDWSHIPKYDEDLNAMWEAEQILKKDEDLYGCFVDFMYDYGYSATAKERAKCFIDAIEFIDRKDYTNPGIGMD